MNLGKLVLGLGLAAILSTTGCCSKGGCGPSGNASLFGPSPCSTCNSGCPTGNCGNVQPVAPVQAYSPPPAAFIPNGYTR
jgi:hypothetical protein